MALYNGWVSDITKRFQKRFDDIKAVHNFELGDEFEIALAEVLREVLPERFGVCRGFVVEQSGTQAGDDIIIYERSRFPTLRSLGADLSRKEQVPVEATLAYIEAKHRLRLDGAGGQSLHKACHQVAAVRALRREPVSLNNLAPYVTFMGMTTVPPNQGWPTIRNPLYCAVFARHLETTDQRPQEALCLAVKALSGLKLPDVIAARPALCVPALIATPGSEGRQHSVAIRPFLDVPGNEPIYCEPSDVLGIAFMHMIWSLELVSLGTLPWQKIMNEAIVDGGESFVHWT